MASRVICPGCKAKLKSASELLPKKIQCPQCKTTFKPTPETKPLSAEAVASFLTDPSEPITVPANSSTKSDLQTQSEVSDSDGYTTKDTTPATVLSREYDIVELSPDGVRRLLQQLRDGFNGQVIETKPTRAYQLAVVASAMGMILIVAVYLATVCLLCWLLWDDVSRFFSKNYYGSDGTPSQLVGEVIFLHLAIFVAGGVLLGSLLAPLFRRRSTVSGIVLLRPSEHPLVYAFTQTIARQIGVRAPDAIEFTVSADSYIRRHHGQIVLGLGGPLFLGFDLRGMAGIISQQLGYCRQTGTLLVERLIYKTLEWLTDAADYIDENEERLVDSQDEDDEKSVRVIRTLIWLLMWVGRLYLRLLASVAVLLAGFLSRRAVYDADRYCVQIAGSDQFAANTRRSLELTIAQDVVHREFVRGKRVIESYWDFCEQVVAVSNDLDAKSMMRVNRCLKDESSGWFDTHPTDVQRIEAARAYRHPGMCNLTGPASCLLNRKSLLESGLPIP